MQPAVVALAIALFLFTFVYRLPGLLFYASLVISAAVLVYGLVTRDIPPEPFNGEDDLDRGPDTSVDRSR